MRSKAVLFERFPSPDLFGEEPGCEEAYWSSARSLRYCCASCGRQAAPSDRVPGGPRDPDLSVQAGGYPDNHFSGPVYIPRFSPMENGTTVYDVTYKDGVTVISRKDTMQHLVSIPTKWELRF